MRHMRKKHRPALEKKLEAEKVMDNSAVSTSSCITEVLPDEKLVDAVGELLTLLVDDPTLRSLGWPDTPVHEVLENVIKRCGHKAVSPENYDYYARLRENSKLLFTVVIDDTSVKTLLNNQTVDEVILHVLRLAKQQQ